MDSLRYRGYNQSSSLPLSQVSQARDKLTFPRHPRSVTLRRRTSGFCSSLSSQLSSSLAFHRPSRLFALSHVAPRGFDRFLWRDQDGSVGGASASGFSGTNSNGSWRFPVWLKLATGSIFAFQAKESSQLTIQNIKGQR